MATSITSKVSSESVVDAVTVEEDTPNGTTIPENRTSTKRGKCPVSHNVARRLEVIVLTVVVVCVVVLLSLPSVFLLAEHVSNKRVYNVMNSMTIYIIVVAIKLHIATYIHSECVRCIKLRI